MRKKGKHEYMCGRNEEKNVAISFVKGWARAFLVVALVVSRSRAEPSALALSVLLQTLNLALVIWRSQCSSALLHLYTSVCTYTVYNNERTAKKGQRERDSENGTARTGQRGGIRQDRAGRTGLAKQDGQSGQAE